MRVRSLELIHYGVHRGLVLDRLDAPRLMVVQGDNEAGKSTLWRALRSLWFGFEPAAAERHPDRPWSGERLELAAVLVATSGAEVEVTRTLTSRPRGRWTMNGETEELANRPLPMLRGLERSLFDSCYALELRDLARSSPQEFAVLEDRLLGGELVKGQRPAREVRAALRAEMQELYREDRRGRPQERVLRERLRELRCERREVAAQQEELRRLHAERRALRRRLGQLRRRIGGLRRRLELAPLARRLQAIRLDRERADQWVVGAIPEQTPDDPRAELARLEEELRTASARREELAGVRRELDQVLQSEARDPIQGEGVDELARGLRDLGRAIDRREHEESQREAAARLRREAEGVAHEIMELSPEQPLSAAAAALSAAAFSVKELGQCLRRYRVCLRDAERAEGERRARGSYRALWMLAPLPFLAAAALVYAAVLGQPALAWLAVLCLVFGAYTGWVEVRDRRGELTREGAAAQSRLQEARRVVAEQLAPLPLRAALREDPDSELFEAISTLRRLLRDAGDLEQAAAASAHWRRGVERSARDLCEKLGVAAAALPEELVRHLEQRRRVSERLAAQAEEARRRLPSLRDRQVEAEAAHARAEERRRDLRGLLARLVPGAAAPEAADRVARARNLRRRAAREQEELEQTIPDLGDLMRRIEDILARRPETSWSMESEERARRRTQQLQTRREESARRLGEIEAALALPQRSLAELDGEMETAVVERVAALRRHDRLRVMEAILDGAERSYRERHQSRVLGRASALLKKFTRGHYDSLVLEEGTPAVHLGGATGGVSGSLLDSPLSRGTLDQAQLALRLALAEHLDEERGEPVPLLLDEALVNTDPHRQARILKVLAQLSERTQVFVLTCHPETARLAREEWGARVLRLAGGRGRGATA